MKRKLQTNTAFEAKVAYDAKQAEKKAYIEERKLFWEEAARFSEDMDKYVMTLEKKWGPDNV